MAVIFLTGFPGFLGSALVERLLDRYAEDTSVTCLIQAKFRPQAERHAAEIERGCPNRAGRIRLVEGDITMPDLCLGDQVQALQNETVEIYHLAAVYDLSVSRDLAMRVNVEGTHMVLRFAEHCPNLKRFQYVSTCYVSGKYDGTFSEADLEKGQTFNNYYEETKYLAEVEVQRRMRNGLPATIYRPSVVAGDSRTGATQKYDGIYYILQWLMRQPRIALMPVAGDFRKYEFNMVSRDFVVDAIDRLSAMDASEGKVYQLCDLHTVSNDKLLDILADAAGRKMVRIPLPLFLAKGAVQYVPGVYQVLRIPASAIDYFVHPTHYTCENTLRDLEGTGIACPPVTAYIQRLVKFMRENPDISAAAMV